VCSPFRPYPSGLSPSCLLCSPSVPSLLSAPPFCARAPFVCSPLSAPPRVRRRRPSRSLYLYAACSVSPFDPLSRVCVCRSAACAFFLSSVSLSASATRHSTINRKHSRTHTLASASGIGLVVSRISSLIAETEAPQHIDIAPHRHSTHNTRTRLPPTHNNNNTPITFYYIIYFHINIIYIIISINYILIL